MKWSKTHLHTLREAPSDAEITSHQLFIRGGYIKKLAPGIYTYGVMALRSIRKLEKIIREELDNIECSEVLMPMVQPAEIWKETHRWSEMGDGLLKFKNRNDHEFCLGATHEEAITDYIRHDLKSYKNLPMIIYQIQTKFRDEIRPRFGLMRGREFIMKDAYSFDIDKEAALQSYDKMHAAYVNIFNRLGLDFRVVKADSGSIGGDTSEEFHVLAESGEDQLMVSTESDFAANLEVCPAIDPVEASYGGGEALPLEEFPTPGLKTIASLSESVKIDQKNLVKTMFFSLSEGLEDDKSKPIAVLLRGDDEVNPIKIKNHLGLSNPPLLLTETEVQTLTGALPGSCGPVGLDIPVYSDNGLKNYKNFTVGANKNDVHLKNVNAGRDFQVTEYADLRFAKSGDKSPDSKGVLKAIRGIEVGHIFYLGTKYSKAMKAQVLDQNGKAKTIEMGCYGLGVSRTIQAAVEQKNDSDGIIWSKALAPFHVHICNLDPKDSSVNSVVESITSDLEKKNIEVFIDDRKERPGVKFKDADLLGFPVRLTIGGKGVKEGTVDVVNRSTGNKKQVEINNVSIEVEEILNSL